MKKIFLLTCLLFIGQTANAQLTFNKAVAEVDSHNANSCVNLDIARVGCKPCEEADEVTSASFHIFCTP